MAFQQRNFARSIILASGGADFWMLILQCSAYICTRIEQMKRELENCYRALHFVQGAV